MNEFVIEYNAITNKNKNIFYFKHYSTGITEFSDWIKYNNICIEDFQELNEEFKNIYLKKKRRDIIKEFVKCSANKTNNKLYKMHTLYYNEHMYMEIIDDEFIQEIFSFVSLMKDIYNKYKNKNYI